MDTFRRLENWRNGKKNRSVSITIDNSYGAACWEVELMGNKFITAYEVALVGGEEVPEAVVYAGEEEFVGLESTINAAIDHAERMGI